MGSAVAHITSQGKAVITQNGDGTKCIYAIPARLKYWSYIQGTPALVPRSDSTLQSYVRNGRVQYDESR
jgi:hypothetical protein